MRSSLVTYGGVILLGTAACVAACANSEGETAALATLDAGRDDIVIPDGGEGGPADEIDAAADPPPDAGAPSCSSAGWCRTELPDEDLSLKDVWSVPGHAFVLAESSTLGIKVLEWSDTDGKWDYIDDGTQNERGFGAYLGGIWAPNADELYYGIAPGYVYHGRRTGGSLGSWTWTRRALADNSHPDVVEPLDGNPIYQGFRYPALGIFGTSSENVYAWFTNTIYRMDRAGGGAAEWVPEYIADPSPLLTEHVYFLSATSTGSGTIWFSGARTRKFSPQIGILYSACSLLVRRTADGYERVADGTLASASSPCDVLPGSLSIGDGSGELVDLQAASENALVGIKRGREIVKISLAGDEPTVVSAPSVTAQIMPTTANPPLLSSLYATPDTLWLSLAQFVARADNQTLWDGGPYQLTSVTANGAHLGEIARVRGGSNSKLWAIGIRNAFYKTTP